MQRNLFAIKRFYSIILYLYFILILYFTRSYSIYKWKYTSSYFNTLDLLRHKCISQSLRNSHRSTTKQNSIRYRQRMTFIDYKISKRHSESWTWAIISIIDASNLPETHLLYWQRRGIGIYIYIYIYIVCGVTQNFQFF